MYINDDHLQSIINFAPKGRVISLYMPTHPVSNADAVKQDKIRLKNAIQEIRKRDDYDRDIAAATEQLEHVLNNEKFWKYQDKGLALFAADGYIEHVPLAVATGEIVHIGKTCLVSPLILSSAMHPAGYVLDINIQRPRLIRVVGSGAEEVEDSALPASLDAESNRDEYRNQLQHQATSLQSHGNAGVHGHTADDAFAADLDRYLSELASAVDAYMSSKGDALLILAGTDDRVGNVRKKLQYQHVADASIQGSIEKLAPAHIYEKALPIITEHASVIAHQQHVDAEALPPDMRADSEDKIMHEAEKGNITSLFVGTSRENMIAIQDRAIGVVERVVRAVQTQGGTFVVLPHETDQILLATCRY